MSTREREDEQTAAGVTTTSSSARPAGGPRSRPWLGAWRDSRVVAWGILAVSAFGVWLAFWPGLVSPDTAQTIAQAVTDSYNNWWTPFGAWALHLWLHLGFGLGGTYLVAVASWICGVYLCARFCFARTPAALVTLIVGWMPPDYALQSGVSRDLFSLGFTLLGFGLFSRLAQGTVRSRTGEAWLVTGAIASEIFAFLSRQNAISCVIALLFALGLWWRWRRPEGALRGRRGILGALVGAVVLGGVVVIITSGLYSAAGVANVDSQRETYVYDIAAISKLSHHDYFPARIVDRPHPNWVSPPLLHQGNIDRLFDPANVITLYPNQVPTIAFSDVQIARQETRLLKRAWLHAISAHPLDYALERLRLIPIQIGVWDRPIDVLVPLQNPTNDGNPLVSPTGYRDAVAALGSFVGARPTFALDIEWPWVLVMVALVVVLLRTVRRLAWHFLLGPIAIVLNFIVLLFTAPATSYRYSDLIVPVTLLLLEYFVAVALSEGGRGARWLRPGFSQMTGRAPADTGRRDQRAVGLDPTA